MAFTTAQKHDIGQILGLTPLEMDFWLDINSTVITSAVETDVLVEVTRWATAGVAFSSFEPKESNKGFRLSASAEKNDIRRNIALLLEMKHLVGQFGNSLQIPLMRG